MRFMVLLKVEADERPGLTEVVRAYDAELARAGVADRARLSARGARTAPDVKADPATGRTVAGFWVFDLDSREDAAAWVRRCPAPADPSTEIEIRLLLEPNDLPERPRQAGPRPVWERAMAF
jgi:hypothetical protein